ncbi:MAG: SufS family cysteine desulfurase [Planctomycetota bacterium]|nr:SufS family cysteine desulfurase [Planctomycetota bacterium]
MNRQSPIDEPGQASVELSTVRSLFPCLDQVVHGHPLVYLDSAATTQKPTSVLAALNSYYREDCSNIHRGVHLLSEKATARYEGVREKVAGLINATDSREVVFTRGTTESINLVARTIGRDRVGAGDEILISTLEHHANIVPWQMLCQEMGAVLRVIPCSDDGELVLDDLDTLLNEKTRIVSIGHVSNAIGTVNNVKLIFQAARRVGALNVLDAAQSVSHLPIDVQDLDCDFLAFSGHKMYGPTGSGVLWGRMELLDSMPPWQGGGDMIRSVSFDGTTYADVPWKFEAGTPDIGAVIGLGAAIDFIRSIGLEAIQAHEQVLLDDAVLKLGAVEGLRIIGNPVERVSSVSFILEGIHPHDVGTIMDQSGVAIRAGHHCAMPLMKYFGLPATIRASFAVYSETADVISLLEAIETAKAVFR